MKINVLCIGTLKKGPEKELMAHYQSRLFWPFEVQEVVYRKKGLGAQTKAGEGKLLLQGMQPDAAIVGLDEHGACPTSLEFAQWIETYQSEGIKMLTFVIGGANGLSEPVKKRCHRLLSFGRLTWPHLLVRGMLTEQIYRAQQILAGHPYHRE